MPFERTSSVAWRHPLAVLLGLNGLRVSEACETNVEDLGFEGGHRALAQRGETRRQQVEEAIQAITVIPVSDALLAAIAELRYKCRVVGHPLHDRNHANDLWTAASALHRDATLLAADGVVDNTPGLTLRQ